MVGCLSQSAGRQLCYRGEERERQGRAAVPYFAPIAGDRQTDKPVEKDRENTRETERKRAWGWKSSAARSGSPPTGRRAFCDGLNERAPTTSQVRATSLLSHSPPEIRMGNGASYGSDLSSWRRGLRPFLRRVDQGSGRREGGGGRVEV